MTNVFILVSLSFVSLLAAACSLALCVFTAWVAAFTAAFSDFAKLFMASDC